MVLLKVLGGGRRVGKSAIMLEGSKNKILLDYGVDISGSEPEFPMHVRPRDLDFVVITHAHLDHSGAAPLLYVSAKPKLYSTALTLELSDILISDFLKLSKYYIPYEYGQVEDMKDGTVIVNYGDEVEERGVRLKFWNAGHIPGSTMVEIEMDGETILYTGDFNAVSTCLLTGADLEPFENADAVVMEGTYAAFDHPPREEVEQAFVRDALEVLESGGNVLVPAFAVGRAQEILCVLTKYGVKYPVYVDGMARKVNNVLLENLNALRDPEFIEKALTSAIHVDGRQDRRRALEHPSVIVSPAAMLKGGASVHYVKELIEDPRNAIFFVSYIIRETPARKLLETGVLELETLKKRAAARIEWYDFSSHCGRRELLKALERLDDKAKLVIVHSEEEVGKEFAEKVAKSFAFETYFPSEGETVTLD
jgi:putative mRNA 3-end processing factor